jgi:medium-chain acyl-[acyl-carrier-protein] hydrolase
LGGTHALSNIDLEIRNCGLGADERKSLGTARRIVMSRPNLNPWATFPRPISRPRLRLFCFPYAGGSSLIYRQWPDGLPADVELCAVQLPGRGNRLREPAYTQLLPLVETLSEVLLPYFDVPFAFFGHSMGASIGFELARRLRHTRAPEPFHLFVSGRRAPQSPETDPPSYHLPEPAFIEQLRQLNGTPQEVLEHPEIMQLLLPLVRADFQLIQTYVYEPGSPLSCPITAFGGIQDPDAGRDLLELWREQTTADFSLQMFSGDHFFLHASRALLLESIARKLYQHQTSASPA